MNIKVNPMLEFSSMDRTVMKKTCNLCEELIMVLASYTVTDDAHIACADNGEVFVTEKELYEVLDVIGRMVRITDEAPCESDGVVKKVLAVDFIGQLALASEPCYYNDGHANVLKIRQHGSGTPEHEILIQKSTSKFELRIKNTKQSFEF